MPTKDIKPGHRFYNESGLRLVTVSRINENPQEWLARPFAPGKTLPPNVNSIFPISEKRIIELTNMAAAKSNAASASIGKRSLGKSDDQRYTPRSSKYSMATARSCH